MDDRMWLRRQEALARFTASALAACDIDTLLVQACGLVAQGLDSPIAKVLKRRHGDSDLLLCASHGIPPEVGIPGATRVPGGARSAAGFAIDSRRPVVSHVPTETRFEPGEIVRRMGVTHSVNVVILSEGSAYGALEADRTDGRSFSEADVDFLQTYANILGAAIGQRRNVERIEALVATQTLLFRELQHRVKNDLQIIQVLVDLQLRRATSEEARRHLEIVIGRIDALRLVHERMFAGQDIDQVELGQYLGLLSATRFEMHGLDPAGPIRLRTQIPPITVNHDRAVALGLITNEFLTNSLKHAFPRGQGTIAISATATAERVCLTLADDGIGRAPDPAAPERGTGLRLIDLLARQIDAQLTWSRHHGTQLQLSFAAPKPPQTSAAAR